MEAGTAGRRILHVMQSRRQQYFRWGKTITVIPTVSIIENYQRMEAGIWRNDLMQGAVGFFYSCRQGDTEAGKKRLEVVTMLP